MFIDRYANLPYSVRRSGSQLDLCHSGTFRSSERSRWGLGLKAIDISPLVG